MVRNAGLQYVIGAVNCWSGMISLGAAAVGRTG